MTHSENMQQEYQEALKDYGEGRLERAETALRSVLKKNPRFEDAYEALSVIFYNQKRYDEAIDLLKKWVRVNPNTVMAHTNLSRCYVAKGMIDEAEHEQAEARRLSWKAELKTKTQARPKADIEAKIQKYKKIIEMDPKDVLGYYSLGQVYLEGGRKREALDTFEKAVQVNPDHSSSYAALGEVLEGLGDKSKARTVYEQGIKVAEKQGDMMPQKKMETRLRKL